MRGGRDSLNTPPRAHLQCLQSSLQAWHRQWPGQFREHPQAPASGLLGKVAALGGSLADEQQSTSSVLLFEQGKAGPGWHGVVKDQQIGAVIGVQAGVEVCTGFADAHMEHALSVEGLVQEDLMGWASLVDQHVGLVHEPLLMGGPANLGVALGGLNRMFLMEQWEDSDN
jgi:hypothetical protein